MQLYAVAVTALCLALIIIIAVLSDELNDYRNFVHELKDELDEKTRKCESLKAQIKKGSDANGLVDTSLEKEIITQAPPSGEA